MLPLEPGDPQAAGPFRLLARLGSGGMGRVFLGESATGRRVAVKLVRPDLAALPGFRDRFRREIKLAMRAGGFWTAPVVDADADATMPWIASQYVDGPSLAERVEADGPLGILDVLDLGVGLAEALGTFHEGGLVHRDLKPSNVLLVDDGPRVIDFGISKALETTGGTDLTRTGTVLGTPGFMSPEQALGRPAGPPSDVFSLGSLLVYAATGEGAFGDGASHALLFRVVYEDPDLARVPDTLRELVLDCLRKEPADRPAARALVGRLVSARQALGGPGTGDVDTARLKRPGRQHAPRPRQEDPASASSDVTPDSPGVPAAAPGSAPSSAAAPPGIAPVPASAASVSVSTPLPDETAATPAPQPAQDASPPAEFTVRDGGPAVFARRLVRPLCVAALLYAAILLVAALFNSQIVLPKAGVVVLLILLLRAVRMAGPYLRPRTLSVRADGLSVRQGPHALSVPWQDIASVTFAGHKDTRELAVTATLSEASATRVPSSLSGAERALQWTVRSSGERAEGLESALRGHAGSRFALAPR